MIYTLLGLSLAWNLVGLRFNWHRPIMRWAWLMALVGVCLNFSVVLANHGFMPVSGYYDALHVADWVHVPMQPNSRLQWLADVHGPRGLRYSLGDAFLVGSLFVLVLSWVKGEK